MNEDYCPNCGSPRIILPAQTPGYPHNSRDPLGKCMDCGQPLGSAYSPYHRVKVFLEDQKKSGWTEPLKHTYGPIKSPTGRTVTNKPVLQNITPKKMRLFPKTSKEELEEMLVAVELLLEHPEMEGYVRSLKKTLEEELAILHAEAGA